MNEPTAAALGFGAHRGEDRRLAVCDLGGGTFDVSIVNVEQGVFEVISTTGDLFLGGEDIDRIMLERLIDEIRQDHGVDVAGDPPSLQRLKHECKAAKHRLSHMARTDLDIVLAVGAGAPLEYRRSLRRDELEFWIASLLDRLEPPCLEAMARCGLSARDIDAVMLVGGITRIPAVQRRIAGLFGRQPKMVNQDEIVAIGAATLSAILDGADRGRGAARRHLVGPRHRRGRRPLQAGHPAQRRDPHPRAQDRRHHPRRSGRVLVDVYEGESSALGDNRQLGRFVCGGLPPARAGEVMVMIELTVDVDGILRVSATEMGSGRRPEIRLRATAGLTRAEVSRLRQHIRPV